MRTFHDITANYHGGNAASIDANTRATPNKAAIKALIIEFMAKQVDRTSYVKEIIAAIGVQHQTISARLSDLKAEGIIEPVKGADGKQLRIAGCGLVRLAELQRKLF